jgi:hypothetical protein
LSISEGEFKEGFEDDGKKDKFCVLDRWSSSYFRHLLGRNASFKNLNEKDFTVNLLLGITPFFLKYALSSILWHLFIHQLFP